MQYKLHRLAPNSEKWIRPSGGRQGQKGVGAFVKEHGFGHEDWNFNFGLATNSNLLGYTVARPAKKYTGTQFGLVLATYDAGGWRAAGYYNGATFLEQPTSLPEAAIKEMAVDVYHLALSDQIAQIYIHKTISNIENIIRNQFIYHCWSIPINRAFVFREMTPIPKTIFNPGRQRMATSFNITERQFNAIIGLSHGISGAKQEFSKEEGERTLRLHQLIERDESLVRAFKSGLPSFSCSICGFDFGKTYGELGAGFIECHHMKPVSEMTPGDKTNLSDLCAVCSNCHRMLHRGSPMLTPEQLRNLLPQSAPS